MLVLKHAGCSPSLSEGLNAFLPTKLSFLRLPPAKFVQISVMEMFLFKKAPLFFEKLFLESTLMISIIYVDHVIMQTTWAFPYQNSYNFTCLQKMWIRLQNNAPITTSTLWKANVSAGLRMCGSHSDNNKEVYGGNSRTNGTAVGGKQFGEVKDVKCFNFLPCQ